MSNDPIRDAVTRALIDFEQDAQERDSRSAFVFYPADPVPLKPEERERMIQQMMATDPRMTRERAGESIDDNSKDELFLSTEYQVALRRIPSTGFGNIPMLHLSIKRIDKEPIHDWRALQAIKNAIAGEECEAFEIYPAESRLVDTANQYHLWAFAEPHVKIPVGFAHRFVHDASIGKSKQRPFAAPDACWPSKAQLAASLIELTNWMRDHTGPSDGTLEMLTRAVQLIEQIDKDALS